MVTTTINGVEYNLATSLRVAYAVQGQHNHAPYSKIFSELGDMCIEDQIGILYEAFKIANPDVPMNKATFLSYYLDNFKLKEVIKQAGAVIKEIVGEEDEASKTAGTEVSTPEM